MSLNKDPRLISVHVLTTVLKDKKHLNEQFAIYSKKINKRDVGFLKNLIYGVLRLKDSLDSSIMKYYKKSYNKLSEKQKNILRIGFYQIDRMNSVPNYASVNTTVEIAKRENTSFSKVVNAVLMNFIRNSDKININKNNHPDSLIDHWKKQYSEQQIADLCKWNNSLPTIWFKCRDDNLRKIKSISDISFKSHPDFKNYLYTENIKFAIDKLVKKGQLIVQSPSSGLVCDMLNISKNDTILDVCASPGGKARYILDIMSNQNRIHINDVNKLKYFKLKKDFAKDAITISCKDASKDVFTIADKILIDAPCSSTGTIQKNPDIKWNLADVHDLNKLQLRILKNMSKYVNNKGAIVYSTCSLNECENFKIIECFLNENKNFKLDNASKFIDSKYVNNKCMSIFPPKHNLEGMFAARLVRL